MKSVLKSILACVVVLVAGLASAQSFSHFNPPPCDFSDQFYGDNGIVSCTPQSNGTCTRISGAELNTEPDGRFGDFRQTGPPATGSQQNWVADNTCAPNDPTRRNIRILATTGGNADDGNSVFSCADQNGAFAVPTCPPPHGNGTTTETVEFISILAFAHSQAFFANTYSRTVGAIGPNGGLDNQQSNDGSTISIGTFEGNSAPAANPRNIRMEDIVGHFEAYGSISQFKESTTNGVPTPTQFAANPCSLAMIQNQQNPNATSVPQPCFLVADTQDVNHNTISNVASPKLRQDWRFATNRNAIDGSDGNCITTHDQNCKHKGSFSDSPFGYFCDDLLGMWVITYFWFSKPPNTTDPVCAPVFANIGAANGFNLDGTPIIRTAHELNDELEANNCGNEAQEDVGGADGGAAWIVCPAIPDPRNGAIATDAFLDAAKTSGGSFLDPVISQNFTCLQQTGKFCGESAPGQ